MSYTNSMVAHLWANQSKEHARSSNGNFHFSGDTIFSYSTPIARLIKRDGEVVGALRTNRTYSVTTSGKHEPAISSALRYGTNVVRVPYLTSTSPEAHTANLDYLTKQIASTFATAKRSNTNYEWRFREVEEAVAAGNNYISMFGLDIPAFTLPEGFDEARQAAAQRAHSLLHPDPASADRRERERARRKQRQEEREAREAEERAARLAATLEEWRKGNVSYLGGAGYMLPVMLRLKPGDDTTLQTSLGAEVPLRDAIRIFRLAERCRASGDALPRDVVEQMTIGHRQVGQFRLDAIDADGTIRAGCHAIPYAESERMAQSLGLIDPPPATSAEAA